VCDGCEECDRIVVVEVARFRRGGRVLRDDEVTMDREGSDWMLPNGQQFVRFRMGMSGKQNQWLLTIARTELALISQ
jgi:hypothetical protein